MMHPLETIDFHGYSTICATRGWLECKRESDDKITDYEYTAAGRLLARGWARTCGRGKTKNTKHHPDARPWVNGVEAQELMPRG